MRQQRRFAEFLGYYARMDCRDLTQACALMGRDLAFPTGPLGKPVITSTQATLWHTLRLAGVNDRIAGCGRLLDRRGVLLGGLALNLTPCVLPMIPINLAIIGAGILGLALLMVVHETGHLLAARACSSG